MIRTGAPYGRGLDESIEELARVWLEAEREASARGNTVGTEARARFTSSAYEIAIVAATREELLIAWHAARKVQETTETGSRVWAEARAVSELLRMEYLAAE